MGLKDDIQNDIINPKKRLSDILRKAIILGHRLKSNEFQNWLEKEINGYSGIQEDIPEYRVLSTQTYGVFLGLSIGE